MEPARAPSSFPPTQWTLVLSLRHGGDPVKAEQALAELCRDYWRPLFREARRRGHSEHDAEDLTQGFFAYLLTRGIFANADPNEGRLRSYLLRTFKYYCSDVWDRTRSQKRGGNREIVPLDTVSSSEQAVGGPADDASLEMAFERDWAHATLEAAVRRLQTHEEGAGRTSHFSEFQPFLLLRPMASAAYAESAARLAMTEGAVRTAVTRLRQKLREFLRRQISETLRDPTEDLLAEEMTALKNALRT